TGGAKWTSIYISVLRVLVIVDGPNDNIEAVLEIVLKQRTQKIFIWVIFGHLLLHRHPSSREIKAILLEIKLEHLEGLHQQRADSVSLLRVHFRTRRKNPFTW